MVFMTFHSVGNVIIPTDELMFFRGVGIPPTSINLVAERHVYVCLVSSNIVVCFISTGKYSICIVTLGSSNHMWDELPSRNTYGKQNKRTF